MSVQARRDVFQAIADPTRREIMTLVAGNALNLNAIADNFSMSRPAISQHIKILTECGLIMIRQQGRERYCEAQLQPLKDVADWMAPLLELWEHRFEKLDKMLLEMQKDNKNPI